MGKEAKLILEQVLARPTTIALRRRSTRPQVKESASYDPDQRRLGLHTSGASNGIHEIIRAALAGAFLICVGITSAIRSDASHHQYQAWLGEPPSSGGCRLRHAPGGERRR